MYLIGYDRRPTESCISGRPVFLGAGIIQGLSDHAQNHKRFMELFSIRVSNGLGHLRAR